MIITNIFLYSIKIVFIIIIKFVEERVYAF
jgi:hypothetical protein